jgi:hypothetical protein
LFIFLAIAGAGGFGVIYYLKIFKPKREREMYGDGDEEYEETDSFEEIEEAEETHSFEEIEEAEETEETEDAYDVDDANYTYDSDTDNTNNEEGV